MEEKFEKIANDNDLEIFCWRTVPKNSSVIGEMASTQEPLMRQVFVVPRAPSIDSEEFKQKVSYLISQSAMMYTCGILYFS